ncbi:MAG: hypothetical protein ACOH2R_22715 [Pseudomonas sp.]
MNQHTSAHHPATAPAVKQTSLFVLLVKRLFTKKKKKASSIYPLR